MRSSEFLETINDWDELTQFCYDYGLNNLEDVYNEEALDEHICDLLYDISRENTWTEIREMLNAIPSSDSGYYLYNGFMDFSEADESDFDSYKESVFDDALLNDLFDEDDEPETDELEDRENIEYIEECCRFSDDPDDAYVVGQEDIEIDELFVYEHKDEEELVVV